MTCNADAFEVGDRVVVEFIGQDWENPRVVGFLDNPKRCPNIIEINYLSEIVIAGYLGDSDPYTSATPDVSLSYQEVNTNIDEPVPVTADACGSGLVFVGWFDSLGALWTTSRVVDATGLRQDETFTARYVMVGSSMTIDRTVNARDGETGMLISLVSYAFDYDRVWDISSIPLHVLTFGGNWYAETGAPDPVPATLNCTRTIATKTLASVMTFLGADPAFAIANAAAGYTRFAKYTITSQSWYEIDNAP
jgi:hypothetical protein